MNGAMHMTLDREPAAKKTTISRYGGDFPGSADTVEICITRCGANVRLPSYAKQGDAGMDVAAAKDVLIAPGETKPIPTGLKVAIPEGYEIQVRPRSGLSLNTPLRIPNAPGTIDSGYRDEICILLSNGSNTSEACMSDTGETGKYPVYPITEKGNKSGIYRIAEGDRIAQLVLQKVPRISWKETGSVSEIGFDRNGGFGSTGSKQ